MIGTNPDGSYDVKISDFGLNRSVENSYYKTNDTFQSSGVLLKCFIMEPIQQIRCLQFWDPTLGTVELWGAAFLGIQ